VVNGLAKSKTALGIIPSGTENVLAQELKIPRNNFLKAAKVILKGKKKRIDLGKVKNKYFVFVCGVGFDAHVAKKVDPFIKKILGATAYPLTALKEIFKYKPAHITLEANGKVYGGTFVIVGNTKLYGARLFFTPKAKIDDGLLDFCIMKNTDLFSVLKYGLGAKIGQVDKFADAEYVQAKEAVIKADRPVLIHTDAESVGKTPVKIKVVPLALDVLVP